MKKIILLLSVVLLASSSHAAYWEAYCTVTVHVRGAAGVQTGNYIHIYDRDGGHSQFPPANGGAVPYDQSTVVLMWVSDSTGPSWVKGQILYNGTWYFSEQVNAVRDQTSGYEMTIWLGGQPQQYYYNNCFKNNGSYTTTYDLYKSWFGDTLLATTFSVLPGQTRCISLGPFDVPVQITALSYYGASTNQSMAEQVFSPTDNTVWFNKSMTDGGGNGQNTFNPLTSPASPVDTIAFSTNQTDVLLKEGFNQMRSEIVSHGNLLNGTIASSGSSILNAVNGGIASVNGNLLPMKTAISAVAVDAALTRAAAQEQVTLQNNIWGSVNSVDVNITSTRTALGSKLDAINTQLQNRSELQAISAGTADLQSKQAAANASLAQIAASMANLNVALPQSTLQNFANMDTAMAATRDAMATLGGKVDSQTTLEGGMASSLTAIQGSAAASKTYNENTVLKLDSMLTALGEVKGAVNAIPNSGIRADIQDGTTTAHNDHTALMGRMTLVRDDLAGIGTTLENDRAQSRTADGRLLDKLDEVKNAIGQPSTPSPVTAPDMSSQQAAGVSAAGSVAGSLQGLADGVSSPVSFSGGPSADTWKVPVPILGTINLDPRQSPHWVPVTGFCRKFLTYIIYVVYFLGCWGVFEKYLLAAPSARQASSAGTAVLGTNLNTAVALGAASIITLVLAAVPLFAVEVISASSLNPFAGASNPFAGASGAVGVGIWALYEFVPMATLITALTSYVAYRVGIAKVYWVATTTVRFITG